MNTLAEMSCLAYRVIHKRRPRWGGRGLSRMWTKVDKGRGSLLACGHPHLVHRQTEAVAYQTGTLLIIILLLLWTNMTKVSQNPRIATKLYDKKRYNRSQTWYSKMHRAEQNRQTQSGPKQTTLQSYHITVSGEITSAVLSTPSQSTVTSVTTVHRDRYNLHCHFKDASLAAHNYVKIGSEWVHLTIEYC